MMVNTEAVFGGTSLLLLIVAVACIIVLIAMCIDLAGGLYKAKLRGEIRSSWGLKRTLSKFIMYEGGMLIAGGIDLLLHLCKLYKLLGIDVIYGIPFITCILGVFLLIVEYISLRERADEKTRTELSRVEQLAAKYITKDELVSVLAEAINRNNKNQ